MCDLDCGVCVLGAVVIVSHRFSFVFQLVVSTIYEESEKSNSLSS